MPGVEHGLGVADAGDPAQRDLHVLGEAYESAEPLRPYLPGGLDGRPGLPEVSDGLGEQRGDDIDAALPRERGQAVVARLHLRAGESGAGLALGGCAVVGEDAGRASREEQRCLDRAAAGRCRQCGRALHVPGRGAVLAHEGGE